MDSLGLYTELRSARRHRAVQIASRGHVHLSARPFVVVAYHLAAEVGAPIGLLYGDRRSAPKMVVIGEPRDRSLRFERLAQFAKDFNAYIMRFEKVADVTRTRRNRQSYTVRLALNAPQVVVPNQATATWLSATLGRSLRYLRTDGENPVDPALPLAGAHLTFLQSRRMVPGSCMILSATDALTAHWTTPQTGAEDESLGTVIAWIDPPADTHARDAATAAEAALPLGPVPDPAWDNEALEPAVAAYNEARGRGISATRAEVEMRQVVREALEPAWDLTWQAIDLLAQLPEAGHVPGRWEQDRGAWTFHLGRVADDRAWFRRVADSLGAARLLRRAEEATAQLDREMALDDPWVMARSIAIGEAVEGEVTGVDLTNTEIKRVRRTARPLVTLRPFEPFIRPMGTELFWSANPGVKAEVLSNGQDEVVLKITAGMGRSLSVNPASMPTVGEIALFSPFGEGDFFRSTLPDHVPWTHQLPVAPEEAG